MRARVIELRLLAMALAGLWGVVSVLLLAGYRPGGPADLLVGLASLLPLGIAVAAVAWPPVARGPRAFRVIAALGVGTAILLLPMIAGLVRQLTSQGLQTLLPSPEVAYAWALAILGTSLFAGLGLARRTFGAASARPGRFGAAVVIGALLAVVAGTALAGSTIANELALRDRPAAASRYGPTDPTMIPPTCDATVIAGGTARLTLDLAGAIDRRPLGTAAVRGLRSGEDFRWLAEVTTTREIGFAGAAVVGVDGWIREPGERWHPAAAEAVEQEALDLALIRAALDPLQRTAAEDLGLGYVEGARARRCRVAVDGTIFRAAFPQIRWLVGDADLAAWRGEIDIWIFADGQLGRAEGRLGGEGYAVEPETVRGDLAVTLSATNRGDPVAVTAPQR